MYCKPLFADTLVLKSGKIIECKILERSRDYIKAEYAGNQFITNISISGRSMGIPCILRKLRG
jgi:hypothetical protein